MQEMLPDIDWFVNTGVSKSDSRPAISLQRRGSFQINRVAYEHMGKPEALQLGFVAKDRIVAFRKARAGERGAYTVHKAAKIETYSVAAKAFANVHDLDISQSRRYLLHKAGEVYYIKLDEPEATSSRGTRA
jgi:hypothetical protein